MAERDGTEIVIGRGEDYHFGHSEQFRSLYDYDPLTCLLPKLAIAEGNIYALSQLISSVLLRSIHMQIRHRTVERRSHERRKYFELMELDDSNESID